MAITQVTSNVIEDNTIKPDKLTTGGPVWDSAGGLSAVAFVGDGSTLTGIIGTVSESTIIHGITGNKISGTISAKGFIGDSSKLSNLATVPFLSVLEVNDTFFTVQPIHNNYVILLNNTATINIVTNSFEPGLIPGHKTYFIQTGTGRGDFTSPIVYNVDNFFETKKQYSVCELEYLGILNGWTLYGDLTSTSLTSVVVPPEPPPTTTITNVDFNDIYSGANYSAGSKAYALSGTSMFATGRNLYGNLGTGDNINRTVFTKLTTGEWNKIVAASTSIYALSGKALFVLGGNYYGQLGLNDLIARSSFTRVSGEWDQISAGSYHVLALSGKTIYTCGYNDAGQLGIGNSGTSHRRSTFTKLTGEWDQISAGWFHSMALSGQVLFGCGAASYGQIGTTTFSTTFREITEYEAERGLTKPRWRAVAAGSGHTLALSTNGHLFATGITDYGQIGYGVAGSGLYLPKFYQIKTKGSFGTPISCSGIYPGALHSMILSGTDLYVTGANIYGGLGLGDTVDRATFTRVPGKWNGASAGYWESYALSGTKPFATGLNAEGQLGLKDYINRLTFTQITGVAV